ncbi:MAG: protein-export chaperone SecB [Alcanivorax sp.]
MSDDKTPTQENKPLEANGLPITVHAQYVRDISFENPNAPDSLRSAASSPDMEVNVNMDAREIKDNDIKNMYEVALTINAVAKRDGKALFVAEVIYGMTVSIGDVVPENQHHPILFIEIPRLAFPFARQILATITSQGGYPPLLLNPVDFQALYMDKFKNEIAEAKQATAEGAVN